ncbi:MAG TPA: phosphatase PAP2 family protein [Candidatus Tumulicola sp.]
MNRRIALAVVALLSFVAFWLLGNAVRSNGEPANFLAIEAQLAGRGVLAAWWLTWTCYPQMLIVVGIVLLALAWRYPAWRSRILFSIASLLVCWRAADFLQKVYARPRPDHWFVKHETAFSFPSSHAAIALGFYALWAVLLYQSELPNRGRVVVAVLAACLTVAVYWARLSLGAHYLTDLAGGALLAIGIVCAGAAALPAKVLASPAGRG